MNQRRIRRAVADANAKLEPISASSIPPGATATFHLPLGTLVDKLLPDPGAGKPVFR